MGEGGAGCMIKNAQKDRAEYNILDEALSVACVRKAVSVWHSLPTLR